jgi:hypothetical protein
VTEFSAVPAWNPYQVGDTRLRDAKQFGGVRLAHAGTGQVCLQRHHQAGTQLHVFGFLQEFL